MWQQSKRRSAQGLIRHKFGAQKALAALRGIDFKFSFEEWVAWWESHLGPDWHKLRGKRSTQFVMGRIGDTGPYHPSNVICITTAENIKMANGGRVQTEEHRRLNSVANRGIRNASAKLTEAQALAIYQSDKTVSELSRKYSISRPVIEGIKTGRNWSHVTGAKRCG